MHTLARSDLKSNRLRESATLNPHPERVQDGLFQSHSFFDPRDLVQVKYEMLRRVIIDGQAVAAAAAAFGFSRVRWYQLRKRLAAKGLVGLLPQSKGPRQASKLSNEMVTFILQTLRAEPELRMTEVPLRVEQQFGVSIHLRSVERALAQCRKKTCSQVAHLMNPLQLSSGPGLSARSDTKPCAARRWRAGGVPTLRIWNGHSSNGRDWQPG
jgi:transposase